MDSKNVIWLSSFFSLLFITFCVTRHLDDLNPNIVSLPNHSTIKETIAMNDDTPHHIIAPKLETPKLETPKVKVQKVEVISTVQKKKPQTQHSVKKSKPTKKKPKSMTKENVLKPIKKHHKKKVHSKTSASSKRFAIGRLYLQTTSLAKVQKGEEFNELNKLIYMYTIKKDTKVVIIAPNKESANLVKHYLVKHLVKTKDIRIVTKREQKDLIKITLTGRK